MNFFLRVLCVFGLFCSFCSTAFSAITIESAYKTKQDSMKIDSMLFANAENLAKQEPKVQNTEELNKTKITQEPQNPPKEQNSAQIPQTNKNKEDLFSKMQKGSDEFAATPLSSVGAANYMGIILILFALLFALYFIRVKQKGRGLSLRLNLPNILRTENSTRIISSSILAPNARLVVFESFGWRYFLVVSPNSSTLIDKQKLPNFEKTLNSSNDIESSIESTNKDSINLTK